MNPYNSEYENAGQFNNPTEESESVKDENIDVDEAESSAENGDVKRKFSINDKFGGRIKKKRNPNSKHISVKRYVAPKNALVCLMEAHSGLNFIEEVDVNQGEAGSSSLFTMSVEVNGNKYTGSAQSKYGAKHAAAEAALAGFITNPTSAPVTPWSSIASFAMFKLFNEWNCNTKPEQPSVISDPLPTGNGSGPNLETSKDQIVATSPQKRRNPGQLPENAVSMNPVMLLHQLRPTIAYQTSQELGQNRSLFTLTAILDDKTFTGTGTSMKKAKLELAKEAIKQLYDIESTWNIV